MPESKTAIGSDGAVVAHRDDCSAAEPPWAPTLPQIAIQSPSARRSARRGPRAANASSTPSASRASSPEQISRSRRPASSRAATSRSKGAVRLATARRRRAAAHRSRRFDARELELDPVRGRVLPPRPRAPPARGRRPTPAEAQLRGGDREHARAGAQVGQRARALRRASASSTSSSRHMRVVGWAPVPNAWPGSTTTSTAPAARLLPGGPHPEPTADQDRLVEVLPAVGPVVGHLGRA